MRAKVARLEKSIALDASRTMIRSLAKDGLMEDGREDLLRRTAFLTSFQVTF